MRFAKKSTIWTLILAISLLVTPLAAADVQPPALTGSETDVEAGLPPASHRLIVELESPPLSQWYQTAPRAQGARGRLDVHSSSAQTYIAQLQAEQAAFVNQMAAVLPDAGVDNYINELGVPMALDYQITFNGLTIDPGEIDRDVARRALSKMPGVKNVYLDLAQTTDLYTSTALINAPVLWNLAGGQANGGAGVKVASMDGGVHHEAPMFSGEGWSYPPGFPENGLGLTANNNGKIIASRAYFRSWDPPAPGDENPWPGVNGTPHGTHTASTAVGNVVTATYANLIFPDMSGVAPGAWVMSYRVFYASVRGDGSFYNAEGIAALEDLVADGADVVNNSWGGGPTSVGGEFDALDTALINASKAGVFVSMSAGNAGPGGGTTDHPSPDYINVAASTTGGTLVAGLVNISAPEPIDPDLQDMPFTNALFGPVPVTGQVYTYNYVTSESVDPANIEGCSPWPANSFTGNAAVVLRGTCDFSQKVYYAQEGGAEFVVIRNHAAGGDALINMSPGTFAESVTISSIFIGHTDGVGAADWYTTHGALSELTYDARAFQGGSTPDLIAAFSSRGPGVGNVLKPDIAAPGVNILAQGYALGATGEDRHLGWGQVSGTSMASPHVAGSAALLRQLHPDWSNANIKSALMSTAKYLDVYNYDGSPAQPLDMGAGRLDLTHAADPGVLLYPPSLSYGLVPTGTAKTLTFRVTSVATEVETYTLSTLYTGGGFTATTALDGFTVSPASLVLGPGESATVEVTFDPADGMGIGDNQGYVILDGETYDAHLPAWARVEPPPAEADVLIVSNDSWWLLGFPSYLDYYTGALDALGLTYDVYVTDFYYGNATTLPTPAVLFSYDAILYFTGDNWYPDGTFTVATPLTALDLDILTQYANNGGTILAMGQDLASVLGAAVAGPSDLLFYGWVLGTEWLQDSVTGYGSPTLPVTSMPDVPPAFADTLLSLSGPSVAEVSLLGVNEVPPVATTAEGAAMFVFNTADLSLDYMISIDVVEDTTITAVDIYSGTPDINGDPIIDIFTDVFTPPVVVTEAVPLVWGGSVTLTPDQVALLAAGELYVNVLTEDHPTGELRGQIETGINRDGADNQYYIDELKLSDPLDPDYRALFQYAGPYNVEDGIVGVSHRDQPSLETPGITYLGRSVYTSFGLEGVNTVAGYDSRADLLELLLNWAWDEPTVEISLTQSVTTSNLMIFEANVTSNIPGVTGEKYRWDFGDGSEYVEPPIETSNNTASHSYAFCGIYTVRAEVTDNYGNVAIGSAQVTVDVCTGYRIYLPLIGKIAVP